VRRESPRSITASRAICASTSRWKTGKSPRPGHRARCGGASSRSCKARSARRLDIVQRICGVCTPACDGPPYVGRECAQSRNSAERQYIRNMIMSPIRCMITSSTSTICQRSIGSTWYRLEGRPGQGGTAGGKLSIGKEHRHVMTDVQNRLKTFVGSGQLGVFTNGYWGHPAMKLPPEVNLDGRRALSAGAGSAALRQQDRGDLGSKTPHIQNLAVGGGLEPNRDDSQSC